jgi:hypothetical protein
MASLIMEHPGFTKRFGERGKRYNQHIRNQPDSQQAGLESKKPAEDRQDDRIADKARCRENEHIIIAYSRHKETRPYIIQPRINTTPPIRAHEIRPPANLT